MATQLGECQIESIEGSCLRFWFKSVYDGNVFEASTLFGRERLVR